MSNFLRVCQFLSKCIVHTPVAPLELGRVMQIECLPGRPGCRCSLELDISFSNFKVGFYNPFIEIIIVMHS